MMALEMTEAEMREYEDYQLERKRVADEARSAARGR
jgi:hypothetical protein